MTPSLWSVPLQVIAEWSDVLGIVRTQAGRLDLSYLRAWATPLDVADLLDRALSPEREDSGR